MVWDGQRTTFGSSYSGAQGRAEAPGPYQDRLLSTEELKRIQLPKILAYNTRLESFNEFGPEKVQGAVPQSFMARRQHLIERERARVRNLPGVLNHVSAANRYYVFNGDVLQVPQDSPFQPLGSTFEEEKTGAPSDFILPNFHSPVHQSVVTNVQDSLDTTTYTQ